MNDVFRSILRALVLAPCSLVLAACSDDGAAGGEGEVSQAVSDACEPVSAELAGLAADCGDYPASGFQAPCENEGAEAEAAGCLDEFLAEQSCLEAQLTAEACSCEDGSFVCRDLPCTEEEDARRACVEGG